LEEKLNIQNLLGITKPMKKKKESNGKSRILNVIRTEPGRLLQD
jgi:hypothetical protein